MSLSIGGDTILIDLGIFRLLFNNSVIHGYKKYENALRHKQVNFTDFVALARKAGIPYTLFFAPRPFVEQSIQQKTAKLLQGITKKIFSLNSRGSVELRDVELIVKDLLRKQELVKRYKKASSNELLGCLKSPRVSLTKQATMLRDKLGLDLSKIGELSKANTLEYIISLLEAKNVFVSQSSRTFMPQIIHNSVRFSGMCIKDKQYPFIFLNNKDESKSFEPEGRKVFTVIILVVCLAKGKFSPISYDEQAKDLIKDDIYRITEEVLMPAGSIKLMAINSIDDLKQESDKLSVTPSALLMRLQRLAVLNPETIRNYRVTLRDEFSSAPKPRARTPKPVNGFKKYNGRAYSKAIFELVDGGYVTKSEARRVLVQNKQRISFLDEFRANL